MTCSSVSILVQYMPIAILREVSLLTSMCLAMNSPSRPLKGQAQPRVSIYIRIYAEVQRSHTVVTRQTQTLRVSIYYL